MAPSQVQIATSALQRLIKEEESYYKELEQQKARIAKLEKGEGDDPENADFQLRQEVSSQVPKNHASCLRCFVYLGFVDG